MGRRKIAPLHIYCLTGTHRVNLILTYITLKGEETRETSHTGQGWTAAHCCCSGSSHPTRIRNSLWGKEPSTEGNVTTITLHSHFLTDICWHLIQLCWKQSSLPPLILYEANHHPWQSWAPLNQNRAWRADPANSGHQVLYTLKTCTALKDLWWFCPSLYLYFGLRRHKIFPFFLYILILKLKKRKMLHKDG